MSIKQVVGAAEDQKNGAVATSTTATHHILRINVFHNHRQTIQYIQPNDYHLLSQAELVVGIDEAAAIPLTMVEQLIGNYLCLSPLLLMVMKVQVDH